MRKKASVTLDWDLVPNLDDIIECVAVFALCKAGEPIYIGFAHSETVTIRNEIKKTLMRKKISEEVEIWIGYIIATDIERITSEFVGDIKWLFTCTLQPHYNEKCTKTKPDRNLMIKNKGCKYLPKVLGIENYTIYSSDSRVLE